MLSVSDGAEVTGITAWLKEQAIEGFAIAGQLVTLKCNQDYFVTIPGILLSRSIAVKEPSEYRHAS